MRFLTLAVGSRYVEEAELLAESAARFGVEVEVVEKPDRGAWKLNCRQKFEMLVERGLGDEELVVLDADVRFRGQPDLLVGGGWGDRILTAKVTRGYVSTAVCAFGTGKKMRGVVREWGRWMERRPYGTEDRMLRRAVGEVGVQVDVLPPEYHVRWWKSGGVRDEDVVLTLGRRAADWDGKKWVGRTAKLEKRRA